MKNLSLFKVLFLALAVFAISSCGEDDPADSALSPNVSFLDGVGIISDDANVAPGAEFTVNISAGTGDNELSSLTIYQDDVQIDASRITFAHTAPANNPQLIVDTDVNGLDWTITVAAHTDALDAVYDFEITDKGGNKTSAILNINTVANTVFAVSHSVSMGCFTTDNTVDAVTNFCLSIDATSGLDALSTVTVYENNDVIDVSRLDWAENPYTLVDGETAAITDFSVSIESHSVGTAEYRMVVTDASGASMEAGVFVTVGAPTELITGVLLNKSGPSGQGGCDLNTGNGNINSTDLSAEIKDEGIDSSLPIDANWIQRISGANGSEIRAANNLPEGFKFDNIAIQEEIIGAFDQSETLASNITAVVGISDQFVIRNSAGEYFFIKITNVTETDTDNADQYTFDIKK